MEQPRDTANEGVGPGDEEAVDPERTGPEVNFAVLVVALVACAAVVGIAIGISRAETTKEREGTHAELARYGRFVQGELGTLAAARAANLRKLDDARTRADQAVSTRALARAHATAAQALEDGEAPAGWQAKERTLARSLSGVALAYRRLSRASADGRQRGYAEARRDVHAAEARLGRALAPFRELP